MAAALWLHVVALLVRAPSVGDAPRRVVEAATRAVELDSAPALARLMRTRLARRPGDREARFALATLARLGYDYDAAEREYRELRGAAGPHATAASDEWARYGALGQGAALATRGLFPAALEWYRAALEEARSVSDTALLIEAGSGLTAAVARVRGAAAAAPLLDSIAPLATGASLRLQAVYFCRRAWLDGLQGLPSVRARARAGADLAHRAGDRRLEGTCLFIVGSDFARAGLIDSAGLLIDVAQLQRAARDRSGLAATLQWTGYSYMVVGKYEQARRDLTRALVESRASGNLNVELWTRVSLTALALTFQNLEGALEQARRVTALAVRTGDAFATTQARQHEAEIARRRGDTQTAALLWTAMLAEAERGGQWRDAFFALVALAQVALADRAPARAAEYVARAGPVLRRARMSGWDQSLASLDARSALAAGALARADSLGASYLAALAPSQHAFRYSARTLRAALAARRGDPARAESELRTAMADFETWRGTLNDSTDRMFSTQLVGTAGFEDGFSTVLASLVRSGRSSSALELAEVRRARELRTRMALASAYRGASAASAGARAPGHTSPGVSMNAASFVGSLPDSETVLIEFVTAGRAESTAVIVAHRSGVRGYVAPPIDSLERDVLRLSALASDGQEAPATARRLGTVLLGEALRGLPHGVRRLVIVADGPLHRLPFDVLRVGDDRPLVTRFAISSAPSAAVMQALWSRPAATAAPRLLAFGDPLLPGDAAGEVPLQRLPGAAAEVRAIARLTGAADVRLRGDASEAFLKTAALRDYRVVHFATHALVSDWSAARSALVLAPDDDEDGFVGPAELAQLDLAADLVVLSACRTARGRVMNGEGVEGLAAPLLQAGARAVLATAWELGDQSGARLVTDVYARLVRGVSVGDAVHGAKQAAYARGESPRTWAVLTLVGDPGVRPWRAVERRAR